MPTGEDTLISRPSPPSQATDTATPAIAEDETDAREDDGERQDDGEGDTSVAPQHPKGGIATTAAITSHSSSATKGDIPARGPPEPDEDGIVWV